MGLVYFETGSTANYTIFVPEGQLNDKVFFQVDEHGKIVAVNSVVAFRCDFHFELRIHSSF